MSLAPGTRVGPYEVAGSLGTGGMGEVYRATDTNLKRQVAIKVLPAALAGDVERLARFQREAEVLAALNHPHIAAVYGLERTPSALAGPAGSLTALVMELVEGEDLSQRIARLRAPGASARQAGMPLDEALPIARQIAEALEAAHEQGIIHRDLKPANIKVRADGTVKVLDFGLAKALPPVTASYAAVALANSPTITSPAAMTAAGVILGTAAYMSPEQARGRPVDTRTDLWSFGCVLYEMLTGTRPFLGTDVTETIAAVVRAEPDWSALPAQTPAAIRRLLRRCLEKDRRRRLPDAAVARLEVEDALSPSLSTEYLSPNDATVVQLRSAPHSAWSRALPWTLAGLFGVAAFALALAAAFRGVDRGPVAPLYASIDVPADYVLGEDDSLVALPTHTPMVFTPDGRSLIVQAARAGKPQLFLRSLDRPDARPIAGTDGALVPFVSPDGKWVGFWAANELRKVSIDGGEAVTICALIATLGPNGAAWGSGDVVVFGDDSDGRIKSVSAAGGVPMPVTAPAPRTRRHVTPFFLADGKRFLFADVSTNDANDARLMVQALDGGDARLVVSGATDGRVLPSGHLAFMRLGTLMTAPFDVARAATTGDAVVSMRGAMQSGLRVRTGANNTGAGMFAVSSLGTLAVVRGAVVGGEETRLVWVTLDGRASPAEPASGAPTGGRLVPRIAPDRSRAVVTVVTPTRREFWFADWTRNVWTACAGCSGVERLATAWSADGRRLLLSGGNALVAHTIDGSTGDRVVVREPNRDLDPGEWLADGRIVYLSTDVPSDGGTSLTQEIKLLDVDASVGRSLAIGAAPAVSPNGRWLAYETAQPPYDVFVQAFPGPGPRTQVSAGGGIDPAWSADGRTLYYLRSEIDAPGSRPVMAVTAVDITATAVLSAGAPRELFRREGRRCAAVRCFDISADGPRLLMRDDEKRLHPSVNRMDLVLNWTTTRPERQ